ncbi:hypothetical protein pb186bvf_018166 [Paramecium bursaria]
MKISMLMPSQTKKYLTQKKNIKFYKMTNIYRTLSLVSFKIYFSQQKSVLIFQLSVQVTKLFNTSKKKEIIKQKYIYIFVFFNEQSSPFLDASIVFIWPLQKVCLSILSFQKSILLGASLTYDIPNLSSTRTTNFAKYSNRKFKTEVYDIMFPAQSTLSKQGAFISMTKRENQNKPTPGPGQYSVPDSYNHIGGLMGSRRVLSITNDVPGVGSYIIQSPTSQTSVLYRDDPKKRKRRIISPGPGQYNVTQNDSRGFKIKNSKRDFSYQLKSQSPGPGAYTIVEPQHVIRKINSKPELKQRRHQSNVYSYMGSDDLNKINDYGKLKVTFTKQVRKQEFLDPLAVKPMDRSPGPAQYVKIEEIKPSKITRFSQTKRKVFLPKEGPGVGSYTPQSQFGRFYQKPAKKEKKYFYNMRSIDMLQ